MKNKYLSNINQQLLENQTDPKWRVTKTLIKQNLPYLKQKGQLNKCTHCAQFVMENEELESMRYQFSSSKSSEKLNRYSLHKTLDFQDEQ